MRVDRRVKEHVREWKEAVVGRTHTTVGGRTAPHRSPVRGSRDGKAEGVKMVMVAKGTGRSANTGKCPVPQGSKDAPLQVPENSHGATGVDACAASWIRRPWGAYATGPSGKERPMGSGLWETKGWWKIRGSGLPMRRTAKESYL